jgi:glycosyltransferase involved in cell wall biosynthesis
MQRLIFLNRYFFPDHSATSQILSDLAFHVAAGGADVHVITSRQLYDDPHARLAACEKVKGVHIHRVRTTQFGRSALLGRGFDYVSFYASTLHALIRLARPDDVIVAKTDPPLISVIAMQAAARTGARLVNWLQDLYPEIAVQLDVPLLKSPIRTGVLLLRDRSLKMASINVAVGELMARQVRSRGVAPGLVHVIPNWVDDEQISPVRHGDNSLRRDWGLADKFVIGYSGNLGRAHEFDTMLAASARLQGDPRIVFLFVGSGHRLIELAGRVKALGLDRMFRFIPYQDRAVLKYSLGVADVHWISLRPDVEGLMVPSKFYGIAAAGRPIIAVTATDGEIAQLIARHQCGLAIAPGQADELAAVLTALRGDDRRLAAMGRRARAMLDAHFTRRQALERWRRVLERVGGSALNVATSSESLDAPLTSLQGTEVRPPRARRRSAVR